MKNLIVILTTIAISFFIYKINTAHSYTCNYKTIFLKSYISYISETNFRVRSLNSSTIFFNNIYSCSIK